MQAVDHLLLSRDIGFDLRQLRCQTTGVQAREYLPALHAIALLGQDLRDTLVAVEGQIDLAQIDVAVER